MPPPENETNFFYRVYMIKQIEQIINKEGLPV